MKPLTLVFILSSFACVQLISCLDKDPHVPDGLKKEIDLTKLKDGLRNLADSILERIHLSRYDVIESRIKGLSDNALEKIKVELKSAYKDNSKVKTRLDQVIKMTPEEMRNHLRETIIDLQSLDTVAVMHSQNEKVVAIAGNIQRAVIPDLNDEKLWASALQLDEGEKKKYFFKFEDFGFIESDEKAIKAALQNSKIKELQDSKDVLIGVDETRSNEEWQRKAKTEISDLEVETQKTQKRLTDLEVELKSKKQPISVQENKNLESLKSIVRARNNEINRLKQALNRKPHAEIQLFNAKDQITELSSSKEVVLIASSKPSCAKCEKILDRGTVYPKAEEFLNEKQNEKPRNWELDFKVKRLPFLDSEKDSTSTNPTDTELIGSCTKHSSKGCVFHVNDEDDGSTSGKGRMKIEKIDSEEFLKKYSEADLASRKALSEVALANVDKLGGSPENIEKVKKVFEYEKMQKTKYRIDHSKEVLTTGEFTKSKSHYSPEELLENTKISRTGTVKVLGPKMQTFLGNTAKVSGAIGKFLLVQNIISSMERGDSTGLAIMAGRYGGESVLKGVGVFGAHLATSLGTKFGVKVAATLVSKSMMAIGKAAGPIGYAVDIGMSVYGLGSAMKRLFDPNASKFEQNDAITDIKQNTADLFIAGAVIAASLALPAFAPVFFLAGLVANLFVSYAAGVQKAHNHVNEVDSQIKLLDYEKDQEYHRYRQGKDTSGYIKILIRVKNANNLVLNDTVNFLVENPDIIGIAIPSRTFSVKGSCQYIKEINKLIGVHWQQWREVIASSCYQEDGTCDNYNGKCVYRKENGDPAGWFVNYKFLCECHGPTQKNYGVNQEDSLVDFTAKKMIYLERDAPDAPVNYKYETVCVPSSLQFKGNKISENSTKLGYLCENAMAVQRTPKSGKFMQYDLGTGHDKIYLNPVDKTDNQFVVDCGKKEYFGSAGSDTFSVIGNCSTLSGIIDGGFNGADNILALNSSCVEGGNITVDLKQNFMRSGNQINISIVHMNLVYGRLGERDEFEAGCTSKYIDGRGGKSDDLPDILNVDFLNCDMQLTLTARNYTNVKLNYSGGSVGVIIPKEETGMEFFHLSENVTSWTSYKFNTPSELLENVSIVRSSEEEIISISFQTGQNATFHLQTLEPSNPMLFLQESTDGLTSQLTYDENQIAKVIHRLQSTDQTNRVRKGANVVSNMYSLTVGNWTAIGGELDDDFILFNTSFNGEVDGAGGFNSFYLEKELDGDIFVNLIDGFLMNLGYNQTISVSNISRLIGRENSTETVLCDLNMPYIAMGGGSAFNDPDIITVSGESSYEKNQMTIVGLGHTLVESSFSAGQLVMFVLPQAHSSFVTNIFVSNSSNIIYLKSPVESLQSFSSISLESGLQIALNLKENQSVFINASGELGNEERLEQPVVLFEEADSTTSTILIDKVDGRLTSYHQLDSNNNISQSRNGSPILSNYFKITSGNWKIIGGNKNDVFQLTGEIEGEIVGGGGENSLYVDNAVPSMLINQNAQEIVFDSGKTIAINSLQRIYGRTGETDNILSGCDTQFVSLNGGVRNNPDIIQLSGFKECKTTIQIIAAGHTSLWSHESAMDFQLHMIKDENQELNFDANFYSSKNRIFVLHIENTELIGMSGAIKSDKENTRYLVGLNIANNNNVSLNFLTKRSEITGPYRISPQLTILSKENEVAGTILINSEDGSGIVLHNLETKGETSKRNGATGLRNIFNLESGSWNVFGGGQDDSFVLYGPDFTGSIIGQQGLNTLIIGENITTTSLEINLIENRINGLDGKVSVNDIQVVNGRPDRPEQIICNCGTQNVNGQGGLNAKLRDKIILQNCSEWSSVVVTVATHTVVKNLRQNGNFTYIINQIKDFEILANHTTTSSHFYQFKASTDVIKNVTLDQSHSSLQIQFNTNLILNLKLTNQSESLQEYSNPVIQFRDSDSFATNIKVRSNGLIFASVSITKGSENRIDGVQGLMNEFYIELMDNKNLTEVVGGRQDDTFRFSSATWIDSIDGGVGGSNSIILLPEFHTEKPLFVDLRKDSGEIRSDNETHLVKKLKNIQIFRGRPSSHEIVLASCDSKFISSADDVWFMDHNCTNYNVAIVIDEKSEVSFSGGEEMFHVAYAGGLFNYKFNVLRSFDPNFEFWFKIRETKQVYYLAFSVEELQKISYYETDSKVVYIIANKTYEHLVDPYLELNQQFYAQPQLVSSDNFHIQISRDGGIFFNLVLAEKYIPLVNIQDELVSKYSKVANKLNVTIMVHTKTDFVYIGYQCESPNVLTNTDIRSHLVGGGRSKTHYIILDLQYDVYIYTGLEEGSNKTRIIDLTEIISKVRNQTQVKYVPGISETTDGHLLITIDEYRFDFPGNIQIMDGVKFSSQIKFLFNSVVLELQKSRFSKRSPGVVQHSWSFKPAAIVTSKDMVTVLTPDDFEYGQEIVVANHNKSVSPDSNKFRFVRKDNELMLTNMGNQDSMGDVSTFMLYDFYNKNETSSDILQDLKIIMGENVVRMNFSDSPAEKIIVEDWDEVMERTEEKLLEKLPEIERQFKIPFSNKTWKKYKNLLITGLTFAVLLASLAVAIISYKYLGKRKSYEVDEHSPLVENVQKLNVNSNRVLY